MDQIYKSLAMMLSTFNISIEFNFEIHSNGDEMGNNHIKASFRGEEIQSLDRNGSISVNLSYPLACTPTACDPYLLDLSPGSYKVELWGASGGTWTDDGGGRGAYVTATIDIRTPSTFLAFIGSKGTIGTSPAFGGGGPCLWESGYTGGGATDLRLDESLESRLLVAGAGAGDALYLETKVPGGDAGADIGFSGSSLNNKVDIAGVVLALGGSQSYYENRGIGFENEDRLAKSGALGLGGQSGSGTNNPGSGGGGGYYGGGGGAVNAGSVGSGAGGSSFVALSTKKYQITDDIKYNGNEAQPGVTSVMSIGNFGNGFARISLIELISKPNRLTFKIGVLLHVFMFGE